MATELILLGGFLGAGKTTLMQALARYFTAKGYVPGLISNDQAAGLVDTAVLRGAGFMVEEVSGSCFCCNFAGFAKAIASLREQGASLILAEPVGSCTDLAATIMQPLQDKMTDIRLRPLTVLVDPRHAAMHPSAAYILQKQQEEADIILCSKSDLLQKEQVENVLADLRRRFPGKTILAVSAQLRQGLDAWEKAVFAGQAPGANIVPVDYDTYAEGEAVLGWLNATVSLAGAHVDWPEWTSSLLERLRAAFAGENMRVAHVKLNLETEGVRYFASLTGFDQGANQPVHATIQDCAGQAASAVLTLNARVESSPEKLAYLVKRTLESATAAAGLTAHEDFCKSLSPGRPQPTYRYTPPLFAGCRKSV